MNKNEITLLLLEGADEKAFRMLLKERMSLHKKTLIEKIFLNYEIASYYYKKNHEFQYYYINELKKIFSNKKNQTMYRLDFAKFLNLYTDVYEKDLSINARCLILEKILLIYQELKNKYFQKKIIEKINKIKRWRGL